MKSLSVKGGGKNFKPGAPFYPGPSGAVAVSCQEPAVALRRKIRNNGKTQLSPGTVGAQKGHEGRRCIERTTEMQPERAIGEVSASSGITANFPNGLRSLFNFFNLILTLFY